MNEFDRWFSDGGDERYRYSYTLNGESVVFDLGGYEGKFSRKIFDKFDCNLYIFEPIKKYYDILQNSFESNNKIKIYDFGFSDKKEIIRIYHQDDASSIYKKGNHFEDIKVEKLSNFIIENDIKKVDLLKINIEGSEFEVLNDLIDNNLLNIFENIQVQFHNFVDEAPLKRERIREYLKINHRETYCYEFVWENWEKKK